MTEYRFDMYNSTHQQFIEFIDNCMFYDGLDAVLDDGIRIKLLNKMGKSENFVLYIGKEK